LTAGAIASPTPNVRDDFLNIAIISEINRLIGDSGYHFAVCDNLGMPSWVVALTRREESGSAASGAGRSSRCEGLGHGIGANPGNGRGILNPKPSSICQGKGVAQLMPFGDVYVLDY
jgi:hypothetical protein